MHPIYILIGSLTLSLVLVQINQRVGSPVLSIIDRWIRWFVFAIGAAVLCQTCHFIERPFWALSAAFFLLWFLGETLHSWLAISALSLSPLPLFPRYAPNVSGEEWPVQPRLLKIRTWLRAQGFHPAQALKAEIGGGIYLRVSVYEDAGGTTRIQITFLPQPNGAITVCYSITTPTADGVRLVTDNLYIPFGGFYPENWLVERRPWARSLPRLLQRHRARLAACKQPAVAFAQEPLSELNAVQNELDRINTEMGFLNPHNQREDHGKISQEGRYRVWKEIWMLNYLGRSANYR
ncbi:MAG TPA: hypothetical protein VFE31_07685 [Opitutaceae bacterium]|nr:hypothetical protein [Opitutaceae bacterium]